MISMPCTGSGYKIEEAVAAGLQPLFFSNFHPEFCRPGPIVPATRIALTRTGPFTEYPLSDTKKSNSQDRVSWEFDSLFLYPGCQFQPPTISPPISTDT